MGSLQIRDSNRAMLVAAVMQQQCKVVDLGIVRDDRKELERVLDEAISSGVDIILTSGGVSMGDRDFVKPLLKEKGKVHFSKVNKHISLLNHRCEIYFFMYLKAEELASMFSDSLLSNSSD